MKGALRVEEPRPDALLAQRGLSLPDLTGLAGRQAWRPHGIRTTGRGLELLGLLAQRPRRVPRELADEADALTDAGVLDRRGALTDDGARLVDAIATPDRHLRAESASGGRGHSFDVSVRGGLATVVATASPLAEAEEGDPAVWVSEVATTYVPVELAAWLALGPAWALEVTPRRVPQAQIMARVDDPQAPPPDGVGELLAAVWNEPWSLSTVQADHADRGLVLLRTGARGLFTLRPDEHDTFALEPVLAADAFQRICALVFE